MSNKDQHVDERSLRLFVNLADELHFGRAAAKCHMSASAATRMIQRLESGLGVHLLERDNRSVLLTRSGQHLLVYARDALQRWQALLGEIQERGSSLSGVLRMYCSVTASYSVLAEILPAVRSHYPGIEIHVNTGDQALALDRVERGQEHLAIAAHPQQLSGKLDFQPLARSPLVCVAPVIPCQVRDMLVGGGALDWSTVPVIIAQGGLARTRLEQWFREQGVKPRVYAYVSGHEAIVSLVALGFGLAVVPQLVLDSSPLRDRVAVVPQGPQLESFDIGLVARRQSQRDPLVRAVWDLAGQHGYTGVHERRDTVVAPEQD
jgi:LysR family positive regulator for ilvC